MDTIDSNDSNLPARLPSSSVQSPAMAPSYRPSYEIAVNASSSAQVNPQGILRGLLRNWWMILLLWLGVSLPLVYLIHQQVEPTYEAYSMVRAEPTQVTLFGQTPNGGAEPIDRFIDSQIQLMLSDRVLNEAIADPNVVNLPFIKSSKSPKVDLRQKLKIKNQDKTYYIRVALESTDPRESAAIVNAVVTSFLSSYRQSREGSDTNLINRLTLYLKDLKEQKESKENALLTLVDRGKFDPRQLTGSISASASAERKDSGRPQTNVAAASPTTRDVTLEQYRAYKSRIFEKEIELKELEYALSQRVSESQFEEAANDPVSSDPSKDEINARVKDLFQSDASVATLMQDIVSTEEELKHVKGVARGADPARKAAERHRDQLQAKYNALWNERYDDLKRRATLELQAANTPEGTETPSSKLSTEALKAEVDHTRHELTTLSQMVDSMKLEERESQSDAYRADKLRTEIEAINAQHDHIHKKLEDLRFTTNTDLVRVELLDPAEVLSAPTSNKRIKFMLIAPVLILGLVLGLFALLEIKAERVADPDALSSRVQSEVFSLPPLPMVRATRKLGAPGDDNQIDRFVQRLDHLRFAVCGDHPEVGLGRCVLITSAIGGEGKTTLAAQLSARCGHAGHNTLLIDADLRRGTLCPLLDVPEGLGLSDVLKDDVNVEDVVIPVQGGTFHLLCAGTPVPDTSRIFQGRGFGVMIAKLRQMYDLIIIDSPPVLPVPDALILGRWTDGAVLASRYDVSRAPQVERARRQLNNVGIPVLGTVINGMRSADSYYGRYSYSRHRPTSDEHDGAPTE